MKCKSYGSFQFTILVLPFLQTSVVVFKYLDILRRMFIPSCKAPERVEKEFGFAARTSLCELNMLAEPPTDIVSAVASASEGNEAGGKTDK